MTILGLIQIDYLLIAFKKTLSKSTTQNRIKVIHEIQKQVEMAGH